jgi:hyaluronan synthase
MTLAVVLVAYGVLAVSHIFLQLALAVSHQIRFWLGIRRHPLPAVSAAWPTAAVIVTSYNESLIDLQTCILSITRQDYPGLRIVCVDDGSSHLTDEDREIYAELQSHEAVDVLLLAENTGKRNAQMVALARVTAEIIVTMDSDTSLQDPAALRKLVHTLRDNPRAGAVTGNVYTANRNRNLLTRLTALRYWNAFYQERAAQSLFGCVLCCSGPLSAYRHSFLVAVEHDYLNERFMGQICTFGDDRHLTNLALANGWQAKFSPNASAYTIVPHTFRQYRRQQVRWNKSFYREALWTFRHLRSRNLYLWYDLAMQVVLPFMFLGALGTLLAQSTATPGLLWRYLLVMVGIGLLRVSYGLIKTRDVQFLLFSIFGLFYLSVVLSCRFFALATINRTGWGTR